MRSVAAMIALVLLSGCAQKITSTTAYVPEVYDTGVYSADVSDCVHLAKAFKPGLDLAQIGTAGIVAGVKAVPQAAVSPLAIPLNAAGAAGGQTLDALGVLNTEQVEAYRKCIDRKTEWDRSALFMDPR